MKNENRKSRGIKGFFIDVIKGMAMGVAFIIPGFSGGSIAAILGIYERLIGAIAGIFTDFKRSIMTLVPYALGLVTGVVALLFPLGWALEAYPIPTVCIFVGLTVGGLPSITDELRGKFKPAHALALLIPLGLAFALSFLPIAADVDLLNNMGFGDYALLFIIGLVGSSALVVPGISGSMLLLIIGYYNPIVNIATNHLLKGRDIIPSLLVVGSVGLGILVGFFLISVLMRWLLRTCRRGTHFAILGFIIGSMPTVYASVAKESGLSFGLLMPNAWYWVISILFLIIGFSLSFTLVTWSKKNGRTE